MIPEEMFAGQFILCHQHKSVPDGWTIHKHRNYCLGVQYRLPVIDLLAANGAFVGWLLGWPISAEGRLLSNGESAVLVSRMDASADEFEAELYEFGGRFVAICFLEGASRLYLDPCGSLAAVYSRAHEIVASTSTLIPECEKTQENQELIGAFGLPEKNSWFPFGLTSRFGVERLVPNHYLELNNWQTVRHWPKNDLMADSDVEDTAATVSKVLKRHIGAVADEYTPYASLTAGRDSRMLLACSREHLDRIEYFTLAGPLKAWRDDTEVASRIASRFGLSHKTLPSRDPTAEELAQWSRITGHCLGGWDRRFALALWALRGDAPLLSGQAGDVVRGYYWRGRYGERDRIGPAEIVKELRLPVVRETERRAAQWLETLPISNAIIAMDLLYVEQRLGCWAGPREYGVPCIPFLLYPFCHRRIIEALVRLPKAAKANKMVEERLIRREWPDLLALPFNTPTGVRGLFQRIQDAAGRRWKMLKRIGM